ncbi:MAG: hypothetical protein PQJ58_04385 [Spirochaetales bacterium]|nr:hypothetical protein [Spirochaetales bacterium]
MNKGTFLLFLSLFLISVSPLSAQVDFRSKIVIVPMENQTGSDQYNPLCNTITDTVSLVLEFLKDYRVLEEDEFNLARLQRIDPSDRESIKEAALEEDIDEIIYGTMVQVDDVFQFTISLYNVKKARVTNTESAEAFSVLEVFDAGDELTAGLISQISDIKIAFGSVKLEQKGGKGNYTVNLDTYPLRNPDKTFQKVLNGQYEISISQQRLTGVETVFTRIIDVVEDQETVVEFTIPPGSPEEFQWMEEEGDALLALGQNEENFDQFMAELTSFQNRTLALEYDKDLQGLRQSYLDQAGELATATLQGRMEEADSSFYSKRVRFDESLQEYEGISSLVETEYEISMLSSSKDLFLSEPQKIQTGRGDLVYFTAYDIKQKNFLFQWNPEDDNVLFKELQSVDAEPYKGDFFVSGWKVFLWEPGSSQIEILDDMLKTLETIPIPDLAGGGSGYKLTVSPSGLIYIIGGSTVRVIDTSRQYDDSGELMLPDRYYSIEETLSDVLASENSSPGDIYFDNANHLNVFYPETGDLYNTDAKGNLLKKINLSLSRPESRVCSDDTGFYYITVYDENSIAKYTPAGELITTIGQYGSDRDQFSLPTGIAVGQEGILFVADSYNARIKKMVPLNAPVLYPQIARYSTDLNRRIDRSKVAVKKDEAARGEVNWKTHTGNIVATSAFLGTAFGLVLAQDYLGNNAANAYAEYQASTVPDDIPELRSNAETSQIMQITTEVGAMTFFGLGAAWGTETLLKIGLDTTLSNYNRKQIQRLDMNDVYETDPDKYRSIRATSRIGIWTGIVPPVLGLTGMVTAAAMGNDASGDLLTWSVAGGILIPPVFSHLHGGRFNMSLLIAGLTADLLAVWGVMEMNTFTSGEFEPWGIDRYDEGQYSTMSVGRALERAWETRAFYILSAAFGIRLAAGIFDTRYGWTYTNNYNRYKAVRPKESEETAHADFDVNPFMNESGGMGLALKVSF